MKDQLLQLQNQITELESENRDLRRRLDKTYEFIHHIGNPEYASKQDWDGVTNTQSVTTGNSERLNMLTRQFGIDEYPLE